MNSSTTRRQPSDRMPKDDQVNEGTESVEDSMIWQIWVSDPMNKEADILVRWSRTSFFGGSPVSKPRIFEGKEYALFHRCSEEWAMIYTLSIAISNFSQVKLIRLGKEVSVEPYLKDIPRPSGNLLGDASSMGRSGGIC
jgi:hypothetical protein